MASRPSFKLIAPEPEEHELQVDCTRMIWLVIRPGVFFTALDHAHSVDMTPGRNGRPIGFAEMARRKARGVRAGIPDYFFGDLGRGYWIELKRNATAPLNKAQKDVFPEIMHAGFPLAICWTCDQVLERMIRWELARPGVRLAA